MLYFRFAVCLGVGLFGLALVMSTIIDTLFTEWDAIADFKLWWASLSRKKTQFVLIEDEMGGAPQLATRAVLARREMKREKQFLVPLSGSETIAAPPLPAPLAALRDFE